MFIAITSNNFTYDFFKPLLQIGVGKLGNLLVAIGDALIASGDADDALAGDMDAMALEEDASQIPGIGDNIRAGAGMAAMSGTLKIIMGENLIQAGYYMQLFADD